MKCFLLFYLIGIILTYSYVIRKIRNLNDEDRDYASPPEWDFSHIGASIMFPVFWIVTIIGYMNKKIDKYEKDIYDKCNKNNS